ncbi:hypothetical protein, partial [Citrobacter freundii]|uniref:hypothetical protein n=1 Tax=Citrobacter freundii TaxID=546 RepID=UPI0039C01613
MNNTGFIGVKAFSIYSESVLFALISSYLHLDFPQDTGVIYRGFIREGANKRGNSSRLTQSFHFFMFEPI